MRSRLLLATVVSGRVSPALPCSCPVVPNTPEARGTGVRDRATCTHLDRVRCDGTARCHVDMLCRLTRLFGHRAVQM